MSQLILIIDFVKVLNSSVRKEDGSSSLRFLSGGACIVVFVIASFLYLFKSTNDTDIVVLFKLFCGS